MSASFQLACSSWTTRGRTHVEHSPGAAETFHTETANEAYSVTSRIASLITRAIGTKGEEIPRQARLILETRAGLDLRGIQIHFGDKAAAAAKSLKARAFSVSRHIVFGEDQFCPTTDAGLWLLAHEVAHAIRQKNVGGSGYIVGATHSIWESSADAFADFVTGRANQLQFRLQQLPIAPPLRVLRHNGPDCPGPPEWIPKSAKSEEIWLTANNAIELSYKNSHAGHVMIFGGDFALRQTITLPRDAKLSDTDRRFGNQLLLELKGLEWQLRPDIVDFTERKFYEIKTKTNASENTSKVTDQLANYYRIAEAIRVKYGGPQWNSDAPDWYPPHTLAFNSDPDRQVCTSATEYRLGKEFLDTLNRPGLILYGVLERTGSDERRRKRAQALRITRFTSELLPLRNVFETQLRAALQNADDREYLIVCTREYRDNVLMPGGNVARVLSLLNVPAMNAFQNPVVMMRLLGWSIVGISELLYVVVPAQLVLAGEVAAAALLPELSPTLIQVPEGIINGMKAANDVVLLKEAAGFLFVIGVTKATDAQAATVPIEHVGTVRAIPLHSTWGLGALESWVPLDWAGTEYFYLGSASSPV